MAFTRTQFGGSSDALGTNPSVTYTSSITAGHLLLIFIGTTEPTTANLVNPSGWTTLAEKTSTDGLVRIVGKIAGVSEPTTVAFTDSFSRTYSMKCFEYAGNQPATTADGVSAGGTATTNVTSLATGSITPTDTDDLMFAGVFMVAGNTGATSVDSSYTRVSPSSFSIVGEKLKTTATAENPTFGWTTASHALAIQVAFVSALKALAGSTAGTSTTAANMTVLTIVPLTGSTAGTASTAASASVQARMTGSTTGTSTVAANMLVAPVPTASDSPSYVTGTDGRASMTGSTGSTSTIGTLGSTTASGKDGSTTAWAA